MLAAERLLANNFTLKLTCLAFGYFLWYLYGQSIVEVREFVIPVYFYNTTDINLIDAPDELTVTLRGSRTDLHRIASNVVALHLDATQLKQGCQHIGITAQALFLPESVNLVHCKPSAVRVTLS